MTRQSTIGICAAALVIGFFTFLFFFGGRSAAAQANTVPVANAVPLGQEVEYAHTYVCLLTDGSRVRNWDFQDRWLKNQLSYDVYSVNGRVYTALERNTNLGANHVRFTERTINVGDGPKLEGFNYRRTLINGQVAKVERVILFVEYNGGLEPQISVPRCGKPRQ